jgi:hypothetical protein
MVVVVVVVLVVVVASLHYSLSLFRVVLACAYDCGVGSTLLYANPHQVNELPRREKMTAWHLLHHIQIPVRHQRTERTKMYLNQSLLATFRAHTTEGNKYLRNFKIPHVSILFYINTIQGSFFCQHAVSLEYAVPACTDTHTIPSLTSDQTLKTGSIRDAL